MLKYGANFKCRKTEWSTKNDAMDLNENFSGSSLMFNTMTHHFAIDNRLGVLTKSPSVFI
jgi:hypothetical protein